MSSKQQKLECVINACLAGSILADEVTALAQEFSMQDIEMIVEYLKKAPPSNSFQSKKEADGYFLLIDMFSALIIVLGKDGIEKLRSSINQAPSYIHYIVQYASDERFSAPIIKQFLSGNPNKASFILPCLDKKDTKPALVPVPNPLAVFDSKFTWELSGEMLVAAESSLRLDNNLLYITVSDGYGVIEGLKVYVLISDLLSECAKVTLNPSDDWIKAKQIEDIIWEDEQCWYRSAKYLPQTETPWWGTYEVSYKMPEQDHRIQIMVLIPSEFGLSGEEFDESTARSMVVNDWIVYR